MSIFIILFWATPSNSSFLWPSNLITNNETPYSGRLCQPWMNFSLDSIKERSLTLAWASKIRLTAWKILNFSPLYLKINYKLTFPLSFLWYRGAKNSVGSIESGLTLTAGECTGFCILKNDLMLFTSVSYELSANERPFEASLQAAIHLAYWSSCEIFSYFIFFDNYDIKYKTHVIASHPHLAICSHAVLWRYL